MKTENESQEEMITRLNRDIKKMSDQIEMFFANFYEHRKRINYRMESNELLISKLCSNMEMIERMLSAMFNWWFLKIGKNDRKLMYPYFENGSNLPDMFAEQKTQIEKDCMYKTEEMD